MWADLVQEFLKHPCPNCMQVGSMTISVPTYRVICQACRQTGLDPFAVGPWDTKHRIVDWMEGEPISFYVADNKDVQPAEPDENWLAFLKDMVEKQTVKGG